MKQICSNLWQRFTQKCKTGEKEVKRNRKKDSLTLCSNSDFMRMSDTAYLVRCRDGNKSSGWRAVGDLSFYILLKASLCASRPHLLQNQRDSGCFDSVTSALSLPNSCGHDATADGNQLPLRVTWGDLGNLQLKGGRGVTDWSQSCFSPILMGHFNGQGSTSVV